MTDLNGWPFPDRPGVPLISERDGWHWVRWPIAGEMIAVQWRAGFRSPGWVGWRNSYQASDFRYLGPCLTPAEVAAREAAAAEAMREACADYVAECLAALGLPLGVESIRALPLPALDALASALAEARAAGEHDALLARLDADTVNDWLAQAERRGLERAAEIADAAAWRCPNSGCTTIATAIRAAAKEIKP